MDSIRLPSRTLGSALGGAICLCALQCGGSTPAASQPPPPARVSLCPAPFPETYAVTPVADKSGKHLDLGGADELLSAAMVDSGCYRVLEREQLGILIDEMKLCSDSNPDKEYLKCDSFAKKGKVLGVQRMVLAEVSFFEPDVKGAELTAKVPGLSQVGIDIGRSYTALTLSVRVADVESGTKSDETVVHAVVPTDKAGITTGFSFGVTAHQSTPMGVAIQDMLSDATKQLATSRKDSKAAP